MAEGKHTPVPPRTDEHCQTDVAWAEFCRQYDGRPRSFGHLSDFQLANAVFLADRTDLELITYQTAAKERIRWLSIELAKAKEASAAAPLLVAALERHDATTAECRIDGKRPQRNTTVPCDLCGADMRQHCGRKVSAAHQLIQEVRALTKPNGESA